MPTTARCSWFAATRQDTSRLAHSACHSVQQGLGTGTSVGGHAAARGLIAFLVSQSCLEGGPLPRARRPELVPAPAAGFSGPGNGSEGLPALGCPSPPVSTQASFPKFSQSRELSLPLPGVCRSGLPRCLLLLPSKVDLGCRNNPGMKRGQLSISGDTDHLRVAVRGIGHRVWIPYSWPGGQRVATADPENKV